MSQSDLASDTCTLAQSAALIGDPWSILILRELFLGTRRFDDFLRQTGMSSPLLSGRLKKMAQAGILSRQPYSERPLRHEYRLTQKGRDLWPVVIALKQWGDRWLADGEVHVQLVHHTCGEITKPALTCSACDAPLEARDVTPLLSEPYAQARHVRSKRS